MSKWWQNWLFDSLLKSYLKEHKNAAWVRLIQKLREEWIRDMKKRQNISDIEIQHILNGIFVDYTVD